MTRVVRAYTPLDEDQLVFRSMNGTEGLSQLFEFEVDLLSPSPSIDMKAVLGKPIALEIQTAGPVRYLNGQVTRFSLIGREGGTSRHTVYRATLRPWLWYLTRSSDCKIFQNKSVVEILEEVFGEYGFAFEKKLSASYRQWEYCVQYQETDLAFVNRLMEHEGIYYYFKHDRNQHTLVLADDISAHDELPGYETINYFAADRNPSEEVEAIDQWQVTEEIRPGSYVVDDFDFKKPKADLSTTRSQPRQNEHADYEMYEWLGDYTEQEQGEHYARIRLEEAQSLAQRNAGHANVRGMAPGFRFTMQNSPRSDDNGEYLVISVAYSLREGGYATGSAQGEYGFDFLVQPAATPFRSPRMSGMPRASGPQTATVVGKPGEEIWTDQYGRVKLQFRWDRNGQSNENSSCWVRVSHTWAGAGFGAVHVPRIGQEVIVDFITGRIDRPIVVGRVYNADEMPPFSLPGEATQSGFVSRSTPGGSSANANAFVFEDKMGAERVLLHAERNLDVEVEADETHHTGKTRTTTIVGHESATYESGEERHITAGAVETIDGGETRSVTGGARETVSGSETRTISGGATETISGGEHRHVTGGMREIINGGVDLAITGGFHGTIDGKEIRFTSAGRTEVVNVLHNTTVNGPSTTVITGPKIVNSPNVTYNSSYYTNNTVTNIINTTTHITNSSTHTINAKKEGWWRWADNHGTLEHTGLTIVGADIYGLRFAASGLNASFDTMKASYTMFEMKNEPVRLRFSNLSLEARLLRLQMGGLRLALQELIVEA